MPSVSQRIAQELGVAVAQVEATVSLLDGGGTVPFIARYRKEATGGLDDGQLRLLEERLRYLRELDERRAAVVESIESQGKMTPALMSALSAAGTKVALEDLYLPYRPRRRTRAQVAREAGLEPLAERLLADPGLDPVSAAAAFVDPSREVADADAALAGARVILVERFAEDARTVGTLREAFWSDADATAKARDGVTEEVAGKYRDYADRSEKLSRMPPHRLLAVLRGEREGALDLTLPSPRDGTLRERGEYERTIAAANGLADRGRPGDAWMSATVGSAWRNRIRPGIEADLRQRMREVAEVSAVRAFGDNVRDVLLAAPAGARATLGLDPGFRSGVKCAVVDATGKVVATETLYPHQPRNDWRGSVAALARLCAAHAVELVAVGNGTASRETDRLVGDLAKEHPGLRFRRVIVSEAGASVYSASAYAAQEMPDLDVTLRGAVSIARRLQDPLAELVKIDPRSIGVGQYQHDVDERVLGRALDAVVEDCVNAVGVDVNTASAKLLARVSGIGEWVAGNIVAHRDARGPFRTRDEVRAVPGLGPKAFELSAGFLRVHGGAEPLDASGVHPESYAVARRMAEAAGGGIETLIGNAKAVRGLRPATFAVDGVGLPTVTDILRELEKPGRDPRPAFAAAEFKEGVEKVADLRPGMRLQGVVTNVADFGAFVDVGVHEDGLVHVSALSRTFVKDPRQVVRPGQLVTVLVLSVDLQRKRVSLSMRLDDPLPDAADAAAPGRGGSPRRPMSSAPVPDRAGGGAFAAAFARASDGGGKGRGR